MLRVKFSVDGREEDDLKLQYNSYPQLYYKPDDFRREAGGLGRHRALFWVDARDVAFPTPRLQDAYNSHIPQWMTMHVHAR